MGGLSATPASSRSRVRTISLAACHSSVRSLSSGGLTVCVLTYRRNFFSVGRPVRYKVSSTARGLADSSAPSSTSAIGLVPMASNRDADSTWAKLGSAVMCRCRPSLLSQQSSSFELTPSYHHDQNSTLNVRAIRRVIKSTIRLWPQKILACPVISGLRSKERFSSCVVTRIVLFTLAELLVDVVPKSFSPAEPVPAWALVAIELT